MIHKAIFFDLETSDANFIGQIVNYAFVVVDQQWQEIDSLCGKVRLSRTQLPMPGAMLANRVNPLTLQADPTAVVEHEAMRKIREWLKQHTDSSPQAVPLIGFNSGKFDLQYLRTSFVRCGLYPYNNKLVHKDLLLLSRHLLCRPGFPRVADSSRKKSATEARDFASLRLEVLTKAFGLLQGKQSHESREDVLLTIRLAQLYQQKYGEDIRIFESVQLPPELTFGDVVIKEQPERGLEVSELTSQHPVMFIAGNKSSLLFLDLARATKKNISTAIEYVNRSAGSKYFIAPQRVTSGEILKKATQAKEWVEGITPENYFTRSTCDIEQDIYRLKFDAFEALEERFWGGSGRRLEQLERTDPVVFKDAKVLLTRFRLNTTAVADDKERAQLYATLAKYANHRYGGALQLSRTLAESPRREDFAEPLGETMDGIAKRLADEALEAEDREILAGCQQFIRESELVAAAGTQLLERRYPPAETVEVPA